MDEQTWSRKLEYLEDDHDELYPTEVENQKERRHAQALQERVGEMRRQEGLPGTTCWLTVTRGFHMGREWGTSKKSLCFYQGSLILL